MFGDVNEKVGTIAAEVGDVYKRQARTRRLIQEGAILEKVLPEVRTMEPSALEDYLMQKLPQHD